MANVRTAPRQSPDAGLIRQLPAEMTLVIPPEFEDSNGHMNVLRYYELNEQLSSLVYRRIGFPDPEGRFGVFSLESRIRHHAEVMIGDTVSGHHRLLAFDGRRFHGMGFLLGVRDGDERVVSTFEYAMAAVDLRQRRVTALPAEFEPRITAELDRGAVPWEPPHFGPISL